jgi:hypothetical protein
MPFPKTAAIPLIFSVLLSAATTGQAQSQAGTNGLPPALAGEQPDGSLLGYVDFEFTVTPEGKVSNPKVIAEEPRATVLRIPL